MDEKEVHLNVWNECMYCFLYFNFKKNIYIKKTVLADIL